MEYCQKVLDQLKIHFNSLDKVILKEMTSLIEKTSGEEAMGYSEIDIIPAEWIYDNNKTRMLPISPKSIYLRLKDREGNYLDQGRLLATLVHEIGHCLTPYVEVKKKNKWEQEYHGDRFYINYLKVARQCYQLGIWLNKSLLQIKALQRLDLMTDLENRKFLISPLDQKN